VESETLVTSPCLRRLAYFSERHDHPHPLPHHFQPTIIPNPPVTPPSTPVSTASLPGLSSRLFTSVRSPRPHLSLSLAGPLSTSCRILTRLSDSQCLFYFARATTQDTRTRTNLPSYSPYKIGSSSSAPILFPSKYFGSRPTTAHVATRRTESLRVRSVVAEGVDHLS